MNKKVLHVSEEMFDAILKATTLVIQNRRSLLEETSDICRYCNQKNRR